MKRRGPKVRLARQLGIALTSKAAKVMENRPSRSIRVRELLSNEKWASRLEACVARVPEAPVGIEPTNTA